MASSSSQTHQQVQEPQQHYVSDGTNAQSTAHTCSCSCSCISVILILCSFVSTILIIGFYGPSDFQLGPHCSKLLRLNSFLVNDVKVQELDGSNGDLILYGFTKPPPLNVDTVWSETHKASLLDNLYQDWVYFLNEGSDVNISYSVEDSSLLSLVIAQGKDSLAEWVEDPTYPNLTLSWNIISGSGTIEQKIFESSHYYFAIGNLRAEEVKVKLNFSIRALSYDTSEAYYECSFAQGVCEFEFIFLGASAAVLTSTGPEKSRTSDEWYVKISYKPRWIAYFVGSGALTILILLVIKLCAKFQPSSGAGVGSQTEESSSERTSLLTPKDDDSSTLGSSYESVSHDEDEDEVTVAVVSVDTEAPKESDGGHPPRLCVICFDAPRDCFFIPCGHLAACFNCGTRIVEEAGSCPICRRKMKKVKKIFTV